MSAFTGFAERVVSDFDDHLMDYGPDEQVARVVKALERFHAQFPLVPHVEPINAFGFAQVETCFASDPSDPRSVYLRLMPLATQLGIGPGKTQKWADQQYLWAIKDQRDDDEERGDGRLGWDCLRSYVDLNLCLSFDDPEESPDAGGNRWALASEWLISLDRLMALVMVSPWSREFMDNAMPMFSYAMKASGLEDGAHNVPTIEKRVGSDGSIEWVQTDRTLADAFAKDREGITEEEARRRAFLGPAGALDPTSPKD
jgi:hypothetical protein